MKKIIPAKNLLDFYKKGFFPMAENFDSEFINLYQPKKRFIIPINKFHVPKKLFKLFRRNTYTFKINNNFLLNFDEITLNYPQSYCVG